MIRVLIFLFAVSFATPAFACALLMSANPKVGSEITGTDKVELEFTSKIYPEKSTITVTDARGKNYNIGETYGKTGDENFIGTKLGNLTPGKYKVTWNVFCDCGQLNPGDYKFTIK